MLSRDLQSSFVGTLLGLALGDALGAPFEGGLLERGLWRIIGRTSDHRMRWTDDTQMTLDLSESLIACRTLDQDDVARRFGRSYRWSRGYGPGAARVLKLIHSGVDWRSANTLVYPEGSFGNGGAMRAPAIALFCVHRPAALPELARASAVVTHAHPLAQEGAVLIAMATALALGADTEEQIFAGVQAQVLDPSYRQRLLLARSWLGRDVPASEVRTQLGNGMLARESCITAIYVALRFLGGPFLQMLDFVAQLGGDVDTIGAMAGAIWGARNGHLRLPEPQLQQLEAREQIQKRALDLARVVTELARGEAHEPQL